MGLRFVDEQGNRYTRIGFDERGCVVFADSRNRRVPQGVWTVGVGSDEEFHSGIRTMLEALSINCPLCGDRIHAPHWHFGFIGRKFRIVSSDCTPRSTTARWTVLAIGGGSTYSGQVTLAISNVPSNDPAVLAAIAPSERDFFKETGTVVRPYNYVPPAWQFRKTAYDDLPERKPMYWGMEIEIEFPHRNVTDAALELHKWCHRHYPDNFILKADGTLQSGFEVVSHPATYETIRSSKMWYDLFGYLEGMGATATSGRCGLHTHVSMYVINTTSLVYTVKLLEPLLFAFSRRQRGEWERYWRFDLEAMLNPPNHYVALYASKKRGTLEFRFPSGTLDYTIFRTTLQMEKALVDFCGLLIPRSARTRLAALSSRQRNQYIIEKTPVAIARFVDFVRHGGYELAKKWIETTPYANCKPCNDQGVLPNIFDTRKFCEEIRQAVAQAIGQQIP